MYEVDLVDLRHVYLDLLDLRRPYMYRYVVVSINIYCRATLD